mmetsp:Transcript_67428/g.140891  ORF Transcript_67428/g.140891 Transcript_67428/m.140891 type:complete len:264 (-) Transcript_67428:27-818(-)
MASSTAITLLILALTFSVSIALDGSRCAIGVDDAGRDGAVGLLQQNVQKAAAGRALLQSQAAKAQDVELHKHEASKKGSIKRMHRQNTTEVWNQIEGAVEISNLQDQINQATDSVDIQNLQKQMDDLQKQFPSWEEVKGQFSDSWSSLEDAVSLDNIQKQLDEAKKTGNSTLQELQKQYDSLSASIDLGSIQDQATSTWEDLQSKGVPLPNLTSVEGWVNNAADTIGDAAGNAADAVGSAVNSAGDALGGAVNSIGNVFNSWR